MNKAKLVIADTEYDGGGHKQDREYFVTFESGNKVLFIRWNYMYGSIMVLSGAKEVYEQESIFILDTDECIWSDVAKDYHARINSRVIYNSEEK